MDQALVLLVSFISVATILLPSAAAAVASSQRHPALNLWPMPAAVSWPNPAAVPLSPSFSIRCPSHSPAPLRYAVARYSRLLFFERHVPLAPLDFPSASSSSSPLRSLVISVSDAFAPLGPGADESYNLSVPLHSSDAILSAASPWGAMRGLETFSQLSWGASPTVVAAGISIADRPLFSHRGIVLDTARNFYPVRDILRTLRAMSYNKLNVFHWHLTDSQSFPILLPSVPELALRGSYGPAMRYTPADVRRVVRYAMRRGIRVVPEIDAPGHTGSWAEAYPDITTCAGKFWLPPTGASLAAEPGTGQLNPLEPRTYEVVRSVLQDVATLFVDPFLHAGADEVAPACWEEDQRIQRFLAAGGTDDQLLETYINSTRPFIVSALNRTAVYWEDVILGTKVKVDKSILPPETTVLQTWNNGPNNTKLLTAAGYRVIVSSSDFYYLDCGQGGWVGNDSRYDRQVGDDPGNPFNYAGGNGGSWCAPFKSWQRVYDYDITYGLSAEEARLVLGGEVALWSEQSDATVVDGLLWPRASAMAEALWSGNRDGEGRKRYAEATDRLNEWRHRMVERGIAAKPIQPLWCVMHPGMCNLVQ